jgi:hypothetical protein
MLLRPTSQADTRSLMRRLLVGFVRSAPVQRLTKDADTTQLAAVAAWEVLQGFYSALPQLDSRVQSTQFNLWTESYGGM